VLVTSNSDMYSGWDSFTIVDTVTKGTELLCANDGMGDPNVFIGRRYTACGETNGNGWIETNADHKPGVEVWIPQACAMDIHNG
jgi:hypothetical protein